MYFKIDVKNIHNKCMELPAEIISKIMMYHSNIRFSKEELLDAVKLRNKFLWCITCETNGEVEILYTILDSDKRIGKKFFKWLNPCAWSYVYNDYYLLD